MKKYIALYILIFSNNLFSCEMPLSGEHLIKYVGFGQYIVEESGTISISVSIPTDSNGYIPTNMVLIDPLNRWDATEIKLSHDGENFRGYYKLLNPDINEYEIQVWWHKSDPCPTITSI